MKTSNRARASANVCADIGEGIDYSIVFTHVGKRQSFGGLQRRRYIRLGERGLRKGKTQSRDAIINRIG